MAKIMRDAALEGSGTQSAENPWIQRQKEHHGTLLYRRCTGLRRGSAAPAGPDRLLPEPRHRLPAGRSGQPGPRLGRGAAPLHGARGCAALPAGQPRPAPAGHGARRAQALAHEHGGETLLMLHAGAMPAWTAADLLRLADEVHAVLRGDALPAFLHQMYGNQPDHWQEALTGTDRLRVIVNALTRLRFCSPDGVMDFESTENAGSAPPGLMPWFDVPGRRTAGTLLAFGHWSTLGYMSRPDLLALDTGCVWGGQLSAVRFGATLAERELLQVQCPQAQAPG